MCSDLPFYYFTLNERFHDEEMPSFDLMPEDKRENDDAQHHPLCLHRMRINQCEDNSIMVPGRAMLPVRNKANIRQRLHKPEMGLPPVPMHLALEDKT